jgi:hypothetical protein
VARYLVIAHQTVTNPALIQELQDIRKADTTAEFTLLVPATPVRHLLFRRGNQEEAAAVADKLAQKARTFLQTHHVDLIDARVGSGSPMQAIDDEVTANPGYGAFVISTLPQEKSQWLRMDLPELVRAKYQLPVRLVHAPPDFFAGEMP